MPTSLTNIYDPATAQELKRRIGLMRMTMVPLWGTMRPAQAMAHCAAGMEMAIGDRVAPRMVLGRIIGWLVKPVVLGNNRPMRRQTPTIPGLEVRDERDLAHEQQRLCRLIDRFLAAGPAGCTRHPHSFFGRLTPEQWAVLAYKHLDHHVRQFGV